MTAEAERALYDKMRRGEIITPSDHVMTIDDPDELESFRKALIANGRMTSDTLIAIYRRQLKIGRPTNG